MNRPASRSASASSSDAINSAPDRSPASHCYNASLTASPGITVATIISFNPSRQWSSNYLCNHQNIIPDLCVVLISTRNPLNIGAAARAMANFGFEDLRVVNPYEVAFQEAVSAVGGAHVLRSARVFATLPEALEDCSLVVGTTAAQHREIQQPIERLEAGVPQVRNHAGKVALLFGSEKFGLSNEDMSYCHALIRIPTVPGTPSMNLGQAVAVCLWEIVRGDDSPVRDTLSTEIPGTDAELLTKMMLEVLDESGYTNRITAVSTDQKIRRWIRRLRIGRRDAPLLLGILRQVLWKFRKDQQGPHPG